MALPHFEYVSPKTLQEACSILAEHQGLARVMAGGTDLLVRMKNRGLFTKYVVGLKRVAGLDIIKFTPEKGLSIGSMTRLSQVAEHPAIVEHYPAVAYAARNTATVAVRNMGTVVGNLCNAAPSADNAPTLLALDASVNIAGPNHTRELKLEEFFKGPGLNSLEPEEIVKSVTVPPPRGKAAFQFLSARSKVDISAVNVGVWILVEGSVIRDVRIFLGAVAPIPMRAHRSEAVVRGQTIRNDLFDEAGAVASQEASPITDIRATAEYRRRMVAVLTGRALKQAAESSTPPDCVCKR